MSEQANVFLIGRENASSKCHERDRLEACVSIGSIMTVRDEISGSSFSDIRIFFPPLFIFRDFPSAARNAASAFFFCRCDEKIDASDRDR